MVKSPLNAVALSVLLSLGLSACGGSSSNDNTPTTPQNTAPTAITLSAMTVEENAAAAEIGTLTTTDTAGDTHTYSVNDDRFTVSTAGVLALKADTSVDFEQGAEIKVTVTSTDNGGLNKAQEFTLTVTDVVDTYKFESKVTAGKSSVSYGGQVARQILLVQLTNYIGSGLKDDVEAGKFADKAAVVAKLMSLYAADSDAWELTKDEALSFSLDLPTLQGSISEVSSSHKNLQGKIAGMDGATSTQHKDWTTELVGWNAKGSISPDGLVQHFFSMIGDNVQTDLNGFKRFEGGDNTKPEITKFYINENGVDLKQMTQKFLLGAVNFSQATDDYLDDETEGKGLKSDNVGGDKKGTKDYTALEHQFDEGFGYFGAARNYNDYTDLEIRAKDGRDGWNKGYNDANGDGKIDLNSEYNFANSVNAAKRDVGSAGNTTPTNLTKDAFDAFLKARNIINMEFGGAVTGEQETALLAQRDLAVKAWEKAISATAIHYINDVNKDLDLLAAGSDDFSFSDLAKHWSELKGFAMNFQFNPNSPVDADKFAELHDLIGMAPVLTAADVPAYKTKLATARTLLKDAYGFDDENVTKW
jgi:hypothetical protein